MRLHFRNCVLDTGPRVVSRDGQPVPLSPKAFGLLEALTAQRPNAVSHDDLRRTLWPDTVTGGTTLARLVSEVRTAIGDADEGDPMIRTVHRFGYAFAGHATEEAAPVPRVFATVVGRRRRGTSRADGRCAIRWGNQLVPLAPGENVIGRAHGGFITLPSSKVSRRHARIVVSPGRVILEDLGSRNGTYVGSQRIESAVELKDGDRIGIGPALLIFCTTSDDALTSMQSAT